MALGLPFRTWRKRICLRRAVDSVHVSGDPSDWPESVDGFDDPRHGGSLLLVLRHMIAHGLSFHQ